MSYRAEMAELSRQLGLLLAAGDQVPAADLPAAVGGHAAVVHLLRTVHGDLTSRVNARDTSILVEAERNPVAVLGRLIHRSPAPILTAPTDVLTAITESVAGERWRACTRAAVLAQHHWSNASSASLPTGNAAWSEMADVAAISEAIAVLRGDLSRSLAKAGRFIEADQLRIGAESGLRLIGHRVRTVAGYGDLPIAPELVPAMAPNVLAVRTAEALPEAYARLASFTAAAGVLSPQDVVLIGRTNALGAITAASALESGGDPYGARVLLKHAERLALVTDNARRLACVSAGDPRPRAQAQQLYDYLTTLRRRGRSLTFTEAANYGRRVAQVTAALSTTAQRQVRVGHWLTPRESPGPGRPNWLPIVPGQDEPAMLAALRKAGNEARHPKQGWLPRPAEPEPRYYPAPRDVLGPAIAAHPSTVRPAHPRVVNRRWAR